MAGMSWKYSFHSSGKSVSGHCSQVPRLGFWSTSPTVFVFVFSTGFFYKPPTLEKLSPGTYSMSIFGSRDMSQGRWEWPVAVVWLPDFIARLVRQVQLIPRHNFRLSAFVFVFVGDGSPTHLCHVTDII